MDEIERTDTSYPEASGDEDVVLQAPQGRSPAERESLARTYEPVSQPEPPTPRAFQFPIRGLMILTLAIAVGLAGRNWLPAKAFAGLLTVTATIIIFTVEFRELGDTRINPITIVLFVACCAAILAALLN